MFACLIFIPTAMPDSANLQNAVEDDPYVWLEDVDGEGALNWVKARNVKTQERLESDPAFNRLRDELLAILDSKERIPFITKRGEYFYNFWKDTEHPRGIWRRTTLDEYQKESPRWDVLLDLDALGKAEGVNWVWSGAQLLKPHCKRALISLSRGGADATTTREFDMEKREWVADGFVRPEAKGGLTWIDEDHVFVQTDFGAGSLTHSGYPRVCKRWTRGTPLARADVVFEGKLEDVSVSARHEQTPGFERSFVRRSLAFYSSELHYLKPSGEWLKLDLPDSAEKTVHMRHVALELREAWSHNGASYPAGALLIGRFDDLLLGTVKFEMLFEPGPNTALAEFHFTRDHVLLNVIEDVKNSLSVCAETPVGWTKEPLRGAPVIGRTDVTPVDSEDSNDYFLTTTGYLTPPTLSLGQHDGHVMPLKSLPRLFDADGLMVRQHFAVSRDGTRVPYFMVSREDLSPTGDHPVLLYGYGGFEISLQPGYSAGVGRAWLTQGGVYVVANIRGGGEYGPRWHQAALKENRLRAYEDFAAVAEDLVSRKVTCARRLAVQGGSNGGLLVGNMITLYPELFHAAVCQVPLLDMRRYHKLLAGASWMAEYGDPDVPEQWEYIRRFSPYHNVAAGKKTPSVLFTTSTRDDRVHPGHARKMMALMEEQGHPVLYYENIEGGHGGAADNKQAAYMQALAWTFLKRELFVK